MRIENENNEFFELTIIDYEFPQCGENDDEYDKNWMTVRVRMQVGDYIMEEEAPLILTWEWDSLANVLMHGMEDYFIPTGEFKVQDNHYISQWIEPYFEFQCTVQDDGMIFFASFAYDVSGEAWKWADFSVKLPFKEAKKLGQSMKEEALEER